MCPLISVADLLPKLGVAVNPALVLLVHREDDRDTTLVAHSAGEGGTTDAGCGQRFRVHGGVGLMERPVFFLKLVSGHLAGAFISFCIFYRNK